MAIPGGKELTKASPFLDSFFMCDFTFLGRDKNKDRAAAGSSNPAGNPVFIVYSAVAEDYNQQREMS